MNALRQEILPPSGVEHAVSLALTPSARRSPTSGSSSLPQLGTVTNLVVARQNFLRVFEVRIEAPPLPSQEKILADEQGKTRRGMEAVEGEVEMDVGGEGFVSAGIVKSAGHHARQRQRTVTKLYLVRQHRLHGIVTGLARVQTTASQEDKLDRLLVSFKDAKIALLEWSELTHDLCTISIHTYERAPQMLAFDPARALNELRIDPNSRCAALTLPMDSIAVLPFYESQAELDMDVDQGGVSRDVPYSPSFILNLPEVDDNIRNIIDLAFLPGFNNPTLAVLFQTQQTWTGRLAEFKDTVRLRIITLDVVTRTYPIIASVDGLPYDAMRLVPCPASLGGVIVITANALLHIDQSGKNVAVATNGWAARVSDFPTPPPERDEALEGSRAVFVSERTLLLVYRDGSIVPVELILEGRMVTKIDMGQRLAQTTIPSVVCAVQDDLVLVGSTAGPSILLKVTHEEEDITLPDADSVNGNGMTNGNGVSNGATYDDPMDSEDEDLYGGADMMVTSTSGTVTVGSTAAVEKRRILRLALADSLCGHGPISDMAFVVGRNGERPVPELLAGVGVGHTGGLTRFQRDLPTRVKRKLHKISGNRGVWSFPVRRAVKVAGMNIERPTGAADWDTVIVSTDATPSPGLSRVAVKDSNHDADILTRLPAITIGAGPFFQRTAILQVISNAIRVLEADGSERQVIKDLDGTTPRAKIRACSISDPFVVIVREDDTLGLFVGETGKGKLRRKDMSMLDKTSLYLAASFYQDHSGLFQLGTPGSLKGKERANAPASTTIEAAMDEGRGSQWLVVCRPQGVVEIWALPKLTLVFSCGGVSNLPTVLTDSFDLATPSPPQDPPRQAEDHDVEEIIIAAIGETAPRPRLLVLLRSGTVAVYDTATVELPAVATGRETGLQLAFVRILCRTVDLAPIERAEKRGAPAPRHLIPFTTSLSGVFLTGGRPGWIIGTDKSAVRLIPAMNAVVHSFTACSLWGSRGDFFMNTDEGPCLVEWMPDIRLDEELPSFFIPRGRPYTSVAYDATTGMVIAASSLRSRFVLFDEDGNTVWTPDGDFISDPTTDTSSLELIDPETWTTVDGFEFAFNEMINTVRTVSLETVSTEAGSKDFIAVGTTVFRGEDLAVKGATYIFEVIEVVPDGPHRRHKLKLWCRDEAKGPVSALCGINGYLVSSMGQKIFVRAFDLNERLVGVAFMDVGIYVTSLRTLKNLLLIGDAVKSVWFVAFQEDPFKLQLLGKDFQRSAITSAEFFFGFGDMAIVTTDEQSIVRIHRYDPLHADAQDGQKLLCQTEFNTQSEARGTVTILRRTREEDIMSPQSKILYGGIDGSLSALVPVEERVFKRLHLLQGQMTRNIQHVAGLHPKAFRVVRNDFAPRPLARGILDGNLLAKFEELPLPRQVEFTKQIGQSREIILGDWMQLNTAW